MMQYLTIALIKAHTRIDSNTEDTILQLYGEAAENTVFGLMNRPMTDFIGTGKTMPAEIIQATLMLVEHSYAHRSPSSPQALYAVPYTIDALIKQHIIL